ncbi:substrate-binding periplasmic protein [Undibacterium umbellatum]|uniref:Transporter substrate-binding domain-containing protein n=1 Tax=Undibacterium umbellatum TaxID=2762300 RepID=A0ABR6Z8U7_9BURK|nr:transporter substrate-binding domain-containing protein [Undibacterium umbellatum]MBC3908180.1 transporter substrate-binding domain-containing protein [Undibacterium umbellatum]
MKIICINACLRMAFLMIFIMSGHSFAQPQKPVSPNYPALILNSEDFPPFNYPDTDGKSAKGLASEKIIELMARAEEQYSIHFFPWVRSFQSAQKDANTCIYVTTRTPAREAMFQWVGPLVKNTWTVFARADDTRRPISIDDLHPYLLGAYRQGAVSEHLLAKGFRTELANADRDNPRKLLAKRFDFWITGELVGHAFIKDLGLKNQIVPILPLQTKYLYLACNHGVAKERIDRLNMILKNMENDGTSANIEKKFR